LRIDVERTGGEEQASCDFWLEIVAQKKHCYGRNLSSVQYPLMVPSSQLPVQDRKYLLKYADSHFISMGENS
jgi:hypothetical protein